MYKLKAGLCIQSRYQLLEELGEGGFAKVFKARDLELGREVALKFLKPDEVGSEDGMARFHREAKLLATLRHKNIVSVYSIDLSGADGPFLVTEYLQGCSLNEFIAEKGALSFNTCKDIFLQIRNSNQID